ncbi:MAG TPA: hydrogenase 2 operon protein HybA [Terriglobales bacterium]|nr:hydrogenase 2 operon protein HybA [Terriglobales bacterium]
MDITRRKALQKLSTGTASAAAVGLTTIALPGEAHASDEVKVAPKNAVSMLYDTTRCVGCKSCVAACAEANQLKPDTSLSGGLHQAPPDLNAFTKNIIKLYKPAATNSAYSYVKQQCMHCVDPTCVAGCSFFALTKNQDTGIVSWNGSKCMGCRYCEISCPFHVPKFEWMGMNPKVVKCEFCQERLAAGKQPACTNVCPTHAVIFGTREQLLAEAKKRVAEHPGKYYQDRVYGDSDAGGTQVLYLSHVPFEKIGLPEMGNESVPSKYMKWQRKLYSYLVVPTVLYVTMVGVIRGNWKEHKHHMEEEQKKTGLRPQL